MDFFREILYPLISICRVTMEMKDHKDIPDQRDHKV